MPEALPEDLAAAWERAREELQASVPPSTFNLWLGPLRPLAARDSTLYLFAPPGIRAWVERRYLSRLLAAMRSQVPELREVQLLSAEAPEPQRGRRATPAARPVSGEHSFDRFVIGSGNRLAHAAALAVAEMPGEAYNPLFLHGAPGLGKTHLLGAIALYLRHHRPDITTHYTTAERFTAEFVTALRHSGVERFKERYRGLNVLLIDDIQFLEDKAHTEEEFFHTFNALYETGGQIVLSCDRPPEALSRLAERLRDRFEWGLRAELGKPDLRTRIALLKRLAAAERPGSPPAEALQEIAARVTTNFRRLEGALIRVTAFASMSGQAATPELVRTTLEPGSRRTGGADHARAARTPTSIEAVQEAVCAVLHLSTDELRSPRRTPHVTRGRHLAMYLARERTGLSLSAIARAFNRDHSTVVHAVHRIEGSLEPGSELHRDLEKARGLLMASSGGGTQSTAGIDPNTQHSLPDIP